MSGYLNPATTTYQLSAREPFCGIGVQTDNMFTGCMGCKSPFSFAAVNFA